MMSECTRQLDFNMGIFSPDHFEYLCLTSIVSSVLMSHSASNSRVSDISKVVLPFFYVRNAMEGS